MAAHTLEGVEVGRLVFGRSDGMSLLDFVRIGY